MNTQSMPASNSTPIGSAVIGFGGMGSWHVRKQCEMKEYFAFQGTYDIREERREAAEKAGYRAYPSLGALLSDSAIEFVVVATPNDTHLELVLAALAAGKHVMCEKPVAMNPGEYECMVECAERNHRVFTVHQNRRGDGDYLTMKKIFDENKLGPVFQIESRVQGSRGVPGDWRNQKVHGGGMVLDWGIHLLDQMLMMTLPRKLTNVYAQLTNVTGTDCDDGFRTMLTFDDGLTAYVEVTTSNFITLPRWYMLGENGSAVIHGWDKKGEIVEVSDWENRDAVPVVAGVGLTKTMAPRTDDTIKHYPLPDVKGNWDLNYLGIYDRVRNGGKLVVSYDQERRLLALIQAIFTSGHTGEAVRFDDVWAASC